MRELIIDGGTTNLRVYLLKDGELITSAGAEGGVRHTAIDGNNSRLRLLLKDCIDRVLEKSGTSPTGIDRCTAYGMITSGLGLLEIPHLAAPAGIKELHGGMQTASFPDICPFDISFIPGVRNFTGEVNPGNVSGMDMMRGEETESIGLAALCNINSESILVLPGSHNKFVHLSPEGRILGCMTSISGELIDAITHHTILSGAVDGSFCSAAEYDPVYAALGARECLQSGIGRAAFSGRILNVLGGVSKSSVRSYLLGAVLAGDIGALNGITNGRSGTRFIVAGKAPMQQAVCDVLQQSGITDITAVPEEVTAKMGITGARLIAGC